MHKLPLAVGLMMSLFTTGVAQAATYYVSTSGSDAGDGLSPANAWKTINHAAQQVLPGDTVYVKAGDYGAENIVFPTDGTAANPIVFEGYQNTPGDKPDLGWSYPNKTDLDATVMPLLDGHDRSVGVAMTLDSRSYVEVHNFQIRNFENAVLGYEGKFLTVDNIIISAVGDINASYSGVGIVLGSFAGDCVVTDNVVYNAAAEAISIIGDRTLVKNNRVYADDNSTGANSNTDYYIHISGDNNKIDGNHIERVGNLDHVGHGIGVKGDATGNLFTNNYARNVNGGLYVRHRGATKNTFIDNTVRGSYGILIRDGASHNVFRNTHVIEAEASVVYLDTGEDGGAQWAGSDNLIINSLFENSKGCVVQYEVYDQVSPAYNNHIINATIIGGDVLFCSDRDNYDNTLSNSIVVGVKSYESGTIPVNASLDHTLFWQVGFTLPTGAGNIQADPLFVAAAADYHLQSTSPAIDVASATDAPADDLDGVARPQGAGFDLGAYEYSDMPPGTGGYGGAAGSGGAGGDGASAGGGAPSSPPTDAGDCGCKTAVSPRRSAPSWWLFLVAAAAAVGRRRGHRQHR